MRSVIVEVTPTITVDETVSLMLFGSLALVISYHAIESAAS